MREKKKSGISRKRWAERKMWEKRRGEGEGEEISREEGTGVVERAWGETVRHGQGGSGQQGGRRGRRCRWIPNEIRISLIDHVRNHGLCFREVLFYDCWWYTFLVLLGQRLLFTVNVQTFFRIDIWDHSGGQSRLFWMKQQYCWHGGPEQHHQSQSKRPVEMLRQELVKHEFNLLTLFSYDASAANM